MLTAREIAALVGGELRGDADVAVRGVAPIDRAGAGDLTFLGVARYAPLLAGCGASVALVSPELADTPGGVAARVVVGKPQEAMLQLLPALFTPPPRRAGVDPSAHIGRGARLGAEVTIGPYVVIGEGATVGDRARLDAHVVIGDGVTVGDDSHLYPHVSTYPGTQLGRRVVVHAGARLGNDGFGFVFARGVHQKIPHVGRCLIDRGSIDDTVIGAGSKIDNLVMIAHNVRIGRLCLIVAQAGIAGSTRIGDGCVIGGQAGIGGHLSIGDGARIAGQAGVFGDVPPGETWSGYPARPHREALRAQGALFRLSGLMRRLEQLVEREGRS
jgi:UDP-3-O-[3-hydroxymyristoyl] glucosamine N-acyltransferase